LAENRGIDPQRLIFAPRTSLTEHLARHRQADLFLDTLPCNAHTTATDALWAGLPIVTCSGNTFAGRVAGSLLHAAGLAELITSSAEDYEAVALALAQSPGRLGNYRRKLEEHRLSSALFDICHFTKTLEAAYQTMITRRRASDRLRGVSWAVVVRRDLGCLHYEPCIESLGR
jgi:predicted O-linked N-acetylglucosamine transferase (SPINDLY family)